MARAPTAKRYALAVFQLAEENQQIDQWFEKLSAALVVAKDQGLRTYFELTKISVGDKLKMVDGVLGDLNPLVRNLFGLLISRGAIGLYPRIVFEYEALLDVYHGRVRAVVTTAVSLKEAQIKQVKAQLVQFLGREVVLTNEVDPRILGGLKARVKDKVIDGSIRGRLGSLQTNLMQAPS